MGRGGKERNGTFRIVVGKNSITQLAHGHSLTARGWDKEGEHGELAWQERRG